MDSTHSVYEKNLTAHLKICNAERYRHELEVYPFYSFNCNNTNVATLLVSHKESPDASRSTKELYRAVLDRIERIYSTIQFETLGSTDGSDLTARRFYDQAIRETVGRDQTAFKRIKHVEQDVAITHKLMDYNFLHLPEPKESNSFVKEARGKEIHERRVFIEYGAGKGLLGLSIHAVDPGAFLTFLEKSGNRKKVDKFLTERGCDFQRYRIDIRHCRISHLPYIQEFVNHVEMREGADASPKSLVVSVVAKHLCGVATDLAIRSLSHLQNLSTDHPAVSLRRGLAIATCCHHACIFEDYVGRDWLQNEFQVTEEEFNLIKSWSGWATLDRTPAMRRGKAWFERNESKIEITTGEGVEAPDKISSLEEDEKYEDEHDIGTNLMEEEAGNQKVLESLISHQDRPAVGRKIKRILDFGRRMYLKENLNFPSSTLTQYCDESLSPECFMILATDY